MFRVTQGVRIEEQRLRSGIGGGSVMEGCFSGSEDIKRVGGRAFFDRGKFVCGTSA